MFQQHTHNEEIVGTTFAVEPALPLYERQAQELMDIANRNNGSLSAHDVVEYARDPDSALHSSFTWDDSEAAEQYRLEQARRVIRTVKITVPEKKDVQIRAFVSVPSNRYSDNPVYTVVTRTSEEERAEVVAEVWRELRRLKAKHRDFAEFAKVWDAIED